VLSALHISFGPAVGRCAGKTTPDDAMKARCRPTSTCQPVGSREDLRGSATFSVADAYTIVFFLWSKHSGDRREHHKKSVQRCSSARRAAPLPRRSSRSLSSDDGTRRSGARQR